MVIIFWNIREFGMVKEWQGNVELLQKLLFLYKNSLVYDAGLYLVLLLYYLVLVLTILI